MELDFNTEPSQSHINTAVGEKTPPQSGGVPPPATPGAPAPTNQPDTRISTAPKIQEASPAAAPLPPAVPKKPKTLLILLVLLLIVMAASGYFLFFTEIGKGLIGLASQSPPALETDESLIPDTNQPSEESSAALTNDAQRKQDLQEIQTALEAYKVDNDSYPVSANYAKIDAPESEIYTSLVSGGYITMPQDPLTPDYWYGYKSAAGAEYSLTARLEDETDAEGEITGDIVLYELTNSSNL